MDLNKHGKQIYRIDKMSLDKSAGIATHYVRNETYTMLFYQSNMGGMDFTVGDLVELDDAGDVFKDGKKIFDMAEYIEEQNNKIQPIKRKERKRKIIRKRKVSPADVIEIRKNDHKLSWWAEKLGVDQSYISRIRNGKQL